ncbi:hypothetical protein MP228_010496 [Amoeboaphelidium protococcarum]|nr:hypothetical protein MP228_010496 [Amoeboaphelidium protococcarum]
MVNTTKVSSLKASSLKARALKAFVENDSRDAVFTWPCTSDQGGSSTVPFSMERVAASYTILQMTGEIKQSIAICLMTQGDDVLESSLMKVAGEQQRTPSNVTSEDARTGEYCKFGRRESWAAMRSGNSQIYKTPSYTAQVQSPISSMENQSIQQHALPLTI